MATRKRVQAIDFKAGKPTRWQAFDLMPFEVTDASERKLTREGFMIVPAKIARTGIQEYGALELGIEGTNRTIRLYRAPDEVFKPESYSTFERQTFTQNHPDGDVTAANYRNVTAGDVHDVAPAGDGIHLGANLHIKAADAIEMIAIYGKNQLSCGYSFELDLTAGTTPAGEAYDGTMRDIVGNHVALVWNARGGEGLRVADTDPTQRKKTMHSITINGIKIAVSDETTASTIEREVKALGDAKTSAETRATAAETALKAATDAGAAAKTAHDAKVAELTAQIVTGDALRELVAEFSKVEKQAKAIVGDAFKADGKSVEAMRVEALEAIVSAKDASPVKAAVTAVLAGVEPGKATPEIAKLAFNGAAAVLAAGGSSATDERGSANDEEIGRDFAPFTPVRDGKGKKALTGEDLFAYRQTHGGKNPPGYTA